MIVWGGIDANGFLNTGGTYDLFLPGAFRWAPMSLANAPSARGIHKAVWAGSGESGQ